jgi:hypothetical protein
VKELDFEWDDTKFGATQLKNDLVSTVAQTEATTAATLASLRQAGASRPGRGVPRPDPDSRPMTRYERIAVSVRSSLVAGRSPLFLQPEYYLLADDHDRRARLIS